MTSAPHVLPPPILLLGETFEEPRLLPFAGGTVGFFSVHHPDKDHNEDSAAVVPLLAESGVLVVADGLGGAPDGEAASRKAVEAVTAMLRRRVQAGDSLREAVLAGIEWAQEKVRELGGACATTLALVQIEGRVVRTYHVGDSEILITGSKGLVKWYTTPHSPVGYAVEAGLMDAKEAFHSEERHIVSNVLGAGPMTVEMSSDIELSPRDTVLLSTDGLADNLMQDEIVELVRKGELEETTRNLIQEARRRMKRGGERRPGKPDDLTVLVYRPGG